jgi:hypothetical protein
MKEFMLKNLKNKYEKNVTLLSGFALNHQNLTAERYLQKNQNKK